MPSCWRRKPDFRCIPLQKRRNGSLLERRLSTLARSWQARSRAMPRPQSAIRYAPSAVSAWDRPERKRTACGKSRRFQLSARMEAVQFPTQAIKECRIADEGKIYLFKSDELTWLCSIAKNLYHDEMRSRQRVADVSEINDLPSDENVENSVADSDMAFRIHLVLHRLEEPYKEVFQLRVFGELSFSQIAAIFGKTESWARVTYHRAKLKIQERMDEKHE